MIQSICVFCGSSDGTLPEFKSAAEEMGRCIAQEGITLIYGGGNIGTMGALADAALQEGGKVVGIIPQKLHAMVDHMELTELFIVRDMHERKALMQEKSDAFITLPGGIGTMEELFEVWAWRYIGYHSKPVGIVNISGFYDELLGFLKTMSRQGFLKPEILADLCIADTPQTLLAALRRKEAQGPQKILKVAERSKKS